MKNISIIIFLILSGQINSFCQDFKDWKKEANYVPNLILNGVDWKQIADSIRANYPNKDRELRDVLNTEKYLKSSNKNIFIRQFNHFFKDGYDQEKLFKDFNSMGRDILPDLVQFLEKDFATRWVNKSSEWDESHFYLCASDIAIKLIEEISGIYFFNNSTSNRSRLSDKPLEEREQLIKVINKWYNETKHLSNSKAIDFYLSNYEYKYSGSRLRTVKNLAIHGDTTKALFYLEEIYKETKYPCKSNLHIVDMAMKLGLEKDLAMEDCLHDIYDYRCMADNGIQCTAYIFKHAKSHIPFDVLADIVSTERYSKFKRNRTRFIWHSIFNEIALTENRWAKSILIELLRIDDQLKDSKIIAYNWQRHYNVQFEANFRVCDFSLYKLNELFPEMNISIDWNDIESIDKEIQKLIEKENAH